MVCLYCAHPTQVINSRLQKKNNQVWRRRKCLSCASIFTTHERIDLFTSLSVRHLGRYKPFSRDKLLISLHASLKHRKTALSDAAALTDTVITKLQPHIKNGSLENDMLLTVVFQTLKQFDKAASTYYRAYHPLVAGTS